ncbi:MAG: molecular chaperone HtpG [Legionellales bacterium]|nr:molecular chaperone HtpG [Legionellales bacterium]|tara:strand:- start:27255 stop:29138 length:1884 start_codon:yes stop_codon:yes gene_type:complete
MAETAQKETLGFQSEVSQVLHLVTHSLYSNKEIFLRELISNASDAEDKLRFEALKNNDLYENDSELKIWVDFDESARTVTIRDNGIGMSRDEAIEHLGTIAKSGTKDFLNALTGEQAKDRQLIGQFGVGFYSAFIVADKVTVNTRRAGLGSSDGVSWESDGKGEFTIETIDKPTRGTEIILHLKADEDEFLDQWRLRNIIGKYSDHISFPVEMKKTDEEGKQTDEYESVNKATALWTLPKSEITTEEYQEFYKHISHDFADPLTWAHNRVEGKLEYTSLLYIPSQAPFDLMQREAPRGLKLYVQRVFIMDNAEQLLPMYLRFVKGIIDSNDLPLNISREILQSNRVIDNIRSATTKRILGVLEKMAENDKEKYTQFWTTFGHVIKEGPAEDFANREQIAKLMRFATTHNDSAEQTVSLDDYIGRMREGQDKIYYVTADSHMAASHSPHLEIFRKKGIEVLLLSDRVDEWLTAHLHEYQGKQLQSIAKGDLDLGELEDEVEKEQQKQVETENKDFIERVKEALGDKVKDVKITHRLTDSPSCVVGDAGGMSSHMERLLQAAGQDMPATTPTLELNPNHLLVERLRDEKDNDRFAEISQILLDQAILADGGILQDPTAFVKRVNDLILK